jgi:hypothetical protein
MVHKATVTGVGGEHSQKTFPYCSDAFFNLFEMLLFSAA